MKETVQVYNNIMKMLRARKVSPKNGFDLIDTQIYNKLQTDLYIYINFIEDNMHVAFAIMDNSGINSNTITKIFKMAELNNVNKLVYISKNAIKATSGKVLSVLTKDDIGEMIVKNYQYIKFLIDINSNIMVPNHFVVGPEEIELLKKNYHEPSRYPKISEDDTVAIWINAKAGDLVKILRTSDTSGVSITYRYCV